MHTIIRVYSHGSGAYIVRFHAALADAPPSVTAATPTLAGAALPGELDE
ncbi:MULTISPECIES: hypothetical protein [unclassified Corynebacterium]|nr:MULTISPECIES: hypothetical protein [unclassified Corynebacterium]